MSEDRREAEKLRIELERSRETIEGLREAMAESTGRLALRGLLSSLLLLPIFGLAVYAAVRLALRKSGLT